MKERPILFSRAMVRAILEGRKSQTRRVVKPQPLLLGGEVAATPSSKLPCPYGMPGDRLWVRETWKPTGLFAFAKPSETKACGRFAYNADDSQASRDSNIPWRPSIHMPRWASRISLEVVKVRVERLQEVSEGDAIAEGLIFNGSSWGYDASPKAVWSSPVQCYRRLWELINGEGLWAVNPWVWVVEFKRVNDQDTKGTKKNKGVV